MNSGMWFYAGWYGVSAAIALAARAARKWQHLIPHRHDGYVSINGYVHPCAVCGSAPRALEAQLAEVREYIAAHPWAGPYMGPGWEDESLTPVKYAPTMGVDHLENEAP